MAAPAQLNTVRRVIALLTVSLHQLLSEPAVRASRDDVRHTTAAEAAAVRSCPHHITPALAPLSVRVGVQFRPGFSPVGAPARSTAGLAASAKKACPLTTYVCPVALFCSTQAAALSASMASVDVRADQIATMARTLLETLHLSVTSAATAAAAAAAAGSDTALLSPPETRGASAAQVASLPLCEFGAAEGGEYHGPVPAPTDTCPICLSAFRCGDRLRELPCKHWHHQACLDQWLRIKNCWCVRWRPPALPPQNESPVSENIQSVGR